MEVEAMMHSWLSQQDASCVLERGSQLQSYRNCTMVNLFVVKLSVFVFPPCHNRLCESTSSTVRGFFFFP